MDPDSQTMPAVRLGRIGLLVGATAIFFWQLRNPVLRFSWPLVNDLLGFALALGLPWGADALVYRLGSRWARVAAIVIGVALSVYSVAVFLDFLMTGFAFKNGRDLSFDQFSETPWRGSLVRLYRTDGGATTDYGVVIRQERTIFPGVLLVRRLDSFYPCYSIDLISTATGIRIKDSHSNCRDLSGQNRAYLLKPIVYF